MRKREDEITVRIAKNGLTQMKLAAMLGVDPDTVRSCRLRAPGVPAGLRIGRSETQKSPRPKPRA